MEIYPLCLLPEELLVLIFKGYEDDVTAFRDLITLRYVCKATRLIVTCLLGKLESIDSRIINILQDEQLQFLPNLTTLNAIDNESLTLDAISKLENLKDLRLHIKISLSLERLTALSNLRDLSVAYNVPELYLLTQLKVLRIREQSSYDASNYESLSLLTNLTDIRFPRGKDVYDCVKFTVLANLSILPFNSFLSLRTLDMFHIVWKQYSLTQRDLFCKFPNLTTLNIARWPSYYSSLPILPPTLINLYVAAWPDKKSQRQEANNLLIGLTNLRYLNLNQNKVLDYALMLRQATSLRSLDIAFGKSIKTIPRVVLTNLTHLNIAHNKYVIGDDTRDLTNLRSLVVSSLIRENAVSSLCLLTSLRVLNQCSNCLNETSIVTNLTNLRELRGEKLFINDDTVKALPNLTALECRLFGEGISPHLFDSLSSLRTLCIHSQGECNLERTFSHLKKKGIVFTWRITYT